VIAETFIPGKGLLYRLDSRPKFIILLSLVVLFLVESNIIVQAAMLVGLLILTGLTLGLRKIAVPIKSILPIIILTALLTPPFNPEGEAILSIGDRVFLSDQGLFLTVRLILRFAGITVAFYLFFSTTVTESFILALRSFGLPYRAALTVTISLRYIPDMFSTYRRISDAHKLRTAGMESKRKKSRFRYRLKHLFPVLTSVLIHAVKSIPSLAMALDSKGLGRKNIRTSCRKLPRWRSISGQLVVCFIMLAALITASVLW
jgi:energy-coupling factor transport system permease protein